VTRRLAAILAADAAVYSRLIGGDEEGTLDRLKSIRAQVIDPALAALHGQLVKTYSDHSVPPTLPRHDSEEATKKSSGVNCVTLPCILSCSNGTSK
jgi:class 3 adenylate cyclase